MKLFSKKLTDEEYVENARKHLQFCIRFRWLLISFVMGAIAYCAYFIPKLICLFFDIGLHIEESINYWAGLVAGSVYFTFFLFSTYKSSLFFKSFSGRSEKIIMLYFNQAKELGIHDKSDIPTIESICSCINKGINGRWLFTVGIMVYGFFLFEDVLGYLQRSCEWTNMQSISTRIGVGASLLFVAILGILFLWTSSLFPPDKMSRLLVKYHDLIAARNGNGNCQNPPP